MGDNYIEDPDVGDAGVRLHALALQIAETGKQLDAIAATQQNISIKAGLAAEEMHAGSFNNDAIIKGESVRAHTDRHPGFVAAGHNRNGPADIVMTDSNEIVGLAQVKTYKSAEKSATALRVLLPDGSPKYEGQTLIGPADQTEGIKEEAHRTFLKERLPAGRPAVAAAAQMVENNISDRLSHGRVESAPLTLADARAIAKHPDGPERQAQEDKSINDAVAAVIEEEVAAGRTPTPDNLFADSIQRLLDNGRGDETADLVWHFTSDDPDLTEAELDRHEAVRDRFRSCAEKMLGEQKI